MNKVQAVGASTLPGSGCGLRDYAYADSRGELSGRRLRSGLARFAAVSRQGAPRSKLTRLPDPAASPHQFLHDRSEYKKFISDTTTTPHGVQSGHAPTRTVTTYLVPQLLFAAEPGQRKTRHASAPYHYG